MKKAGRFSFEIVFDFLLLVLGITIIIMSLGYGLGSLGRPGPGFYPVFIGAAISIFALVLLISELRSETSAPLFDQKGAKTLILMTATFSLWIVAMPVLGYVIVTLLSAYAFCKIMKLEGWWEPLAVSGGTALFIYLLFDYWMYIDLPRGILG
jgi:putative tricarboxylic transport membrane protein